MTTMPADASFPVGPPPPLDPELVEGHVAVRQSVPSPLTFDHIPGMRVGINRFMTSDDELCKDGAFDVEERLVPGPLGDPDVALLICRPTAASGPVPVFYNIHGGGLITGTNRLSVGGVLNWAEELGAAVVSVEYRLPPEHPHPAPVEDCYAGLLWTAEHAAELGIDPERIIVIGGSAGGGLAAATTLLARDRGGPALFGQMLICPMLDDRNDTPSSYQMAGEGGWDHAANETGWTALLGDQRGGPDVSPYASAARATDLSGLPPTLIDVGSAETFRDEAVAYASRMWQAGGNAELHVFPGGFHGYDGFAPEAAISKDTRAARGRWLHRLLNV
ncbi:alpha/beta hydrolase [Streptomyces sp. NPDC002143]